MRNFESVKNNLNFPQNNGGARNYNNYDSSSQLLNLAEIETEVKILRNQLLDEKSKRD